MGAPAQKQMSDNDVLASHYRKTSKVLVTAKPYIIGGLLTWPAYWVYRGCTWQKRKECLPKYIRKTYYQAKLITFGIITAGLVAVTMDKWNQDKLKIEEAKKKASRGWLRYWDRFLCLFKRC